MRRATVASCASGIALLGAGAALISPLASQAASTKVKGASAVTGAATNVRGTSAQLNGSVTPGSTPVTYHFQFGPTIAYGSQTVPATLPAGTTAVRVGQQAAPILAGYHYRLVAVTDSGSGKTINGRDRIFLATTVKTQITLVKPTAPSPFDTAVTISGTLSGTGNANRRLVLQSSPYPYLEPFVTDGLPILTNALGAFSFHVPILAISTQFRISTLDPRPLYSPIVTEQIAPRVTLHVRTSSHKGLVRLYGTITPAEVRAQVFFQVLKAVRPGKSERTSTFSTQFTTVAKRATSTISRFSMVVRVRRGGRYRAYVSLKKGPLVSGASPTVVLIAAPPKKKR